MGHFLHMTQTFVHGQDNHQFDLRKDNDIVAYDRRCICDHPDLHARIGSACKDLDGRVGLRDCDFVAVALANLGDCDAFRGFVFHDQFVRGDDRDCARGAAIRGHRASAVVFAHHHHGSDDHTDPAIDDHCSYDLVVAARRMCDFGSLVHIDVDKHASATDFCGGHILCHPAHVHLLDDILDIPRHADDDMCCRGVLLLHVVGSFSLKSPHCRGGNRTELGGELRNCSAQWTTISTSFLNSPA